jgi:hypothetical protein
MSRHLRCSDGNVDIDKHPADGRSHAPVIAIGRQLRSVEEQYRVWLRHVMFVFLQPSMAAGKCNEAYQAM